MSDLGKYKYANGTEPRSKEDPHVYTYRNLSYSHGDIYRTKKGIGHLESGAVTAGYLIGLKT